MARTSGKPPVDADGVIDGELDDGATSDALATVRSTAMQTKTQYTTAVAVQKPRDLTKLTARVLEEASLCAGEFYFSWPQGGQQIEGVSIDGAMVMVRNFGNCALECNVVEEGPRHWLLKASFIDMETGFTLSRDFRQRKSESHQKTGRDGDADRKLDIAFSIGISKAQRNVVVRSMPAWLVSKAMATAKEAEEQGYVKQLPATIAKAKEAFAKLGVKLDDLQRKLEKPEAMWSPGDARILSALYRAILARETSVAQAFEWLDPNAKQSATTTTPAAEVAKPVAPTPATEPAKTPEATTHAAPAATPPTKPAEGPACIVCGKPVPSDKAAWVEAKSAWRHHGCEYLYKSHEAPSATHAPGKPQRRPEDDDLPEPPIGALEDDPKSPTKDG